MGLNYSCASKNDVRIGGTDWIPDFPTMESSYDEIASLRMGAESSEDRALLMFCRITRGQWFNDGNKRTALMTANHALINAGIGVFSISPSLKREFTTRLLHYYESNDDAPFRSWLKDNAIGRLPGGITSVESRRLELKRSGTSKSPRLPDGHEYASSNAGILGRSPISECCNEAAN